MKIVTRLYVVVSGLMEAGSDRSAPALKVGDEAPDFTLPGSDGKEVKLSSFKGKRNVVLAFFTEALSGG